MVADGQAAQLAQEADGRRRSVMIALKQGQIELFTVAIVLCLWAVFHVWFVGHVVVLRRQQVASLEGKLTASEAAKLRYEEFQALRVQYPELQRLGVGQTAMEYDEYLETVVGHPQLLGLAREALGPDIRHLSFALDRRDDIQHLPLAI